MCVKPADLTTHSPPKTFARPRSPDARPQAARYTPRRPHYPFPAEDLRSPPHSDTPFPSTSAPPRAPTHARRLRDAFPADLTTPSPPKTSSRPRTATRPRRALPLPHAAPTHAHAAPTHTRRLRDAFPADRTTHSPPKTFAHPRTATRPSRALPLAHAAPTHARRLRDAFPADRTTHSPHSDTLPPLPFRFGHKKTAPHSACAMPNVSVDRRCGRSFGLVSRALFAAVAGRWRVGVGLRPQPWALRSRRCGRVLRA